MKKIILSILLFVLFMPFCVNAETCDLDKISISSITIEEKSDNVEELDEATANGKNINLNLSMSDIGDTIVYKIIVKNDSDEDYQFDKNSISINSDYIDYSMESDDDSTIIKANETKEIYLRVEYKNEVPEEEFNDGTFNENQDMVVNLSTGNTISVPDTLKNPKTGVQSYIIILSLLLIISIASYVLLRKKKYMKFMVLIIGSTIIIPISVFAVCKAEINVQTNVTIEKRYEVTYSYWDILTEEEAEKYKSAIPVDQYYENDYKSYYDIDGVKYQYYYVTKVDNYYKANDVVTVVNLQSYDSYRWNANSICGGNWKYYGTVSICNINSLPTKKDALSPDYFWKYSDSDYENLNFTGNISPFNSGLVRGNFYIKQPMKFTMPSHDVSFQISGNPYVA